MTYLAHSSGHKGNRKQDIKRGQNNKRDLGGGRDQLYFSEARDINSSFRQLTCTAILLSRIISGMCNPKSQCEQGS